MEIKAVFKEVQNHYVSTTENIILSNNDTLNLNNKVFVILSDIETGKELYTLQINCEFFCSIFRDVKIWNEFVVIGFDNYCYLFNYKTKALVQHKLNSYFDSFYATNDNIFICSASNINCFDVSGAFLWQSEKLGIHSVKISKIEGNVVIGTGDWDAPKGWVNFEFPLGKYQNNLKVTHSKKAISMLKSFKEKTVAAFASF